MAHGATNPFSDDVFVDHPDNLPGVSRIHHDAFNRIIESVESLVTNPERNTPADFLGRTFLVTAPRAGYGKSHLAARMRHHLRSAATSVSLPLEPARPLVWPAVLSSAIRQISNTAGVKSGNHSLFEETSRYFLAQNVLSQLLTGGIRPKDCPVGEDRLRSDFAEIFSASSSPKMLAWIDKHSREFSREADPEFLRQVGMSHAELGFWLRLLIDHNLRGDAALEPIRGLSHGEAKERSLQFLRIAALYRPLLALVDGLDGFFRSETAGMEIAGLITSIRESVPRSITLVSVNEDVWQSVFENRLPSAWTDRITGETEKLRSISPEAASDLVRMRLKRTGIENGVANQFIERLSSDHLWVDAESALSPRIVLRQARDLWEREATTFLEREQPIPADVLEDEIAQKPLEELTDKVEFFTAPQKGENLDRAEPLPTPSETATSEEPSQSPSPEPDENPFFASPRVAPPPLAGIDSIIADIRGTGKTVVSEAPSDESPLAPPQENPFYGPDDAGLRAGSLHLRPTQGNQEADEAHRGFSDGAPPLSAEPTSPPVNIETELHREEQALLDGAPLQLDLERVGEFLRTIGGDHPGLRQTEERFPSSRTACLRWKVHGESVLLGFESPRNVYFWNNLLQQTLASNKNEKIAAFSHASDAFDPGLFSSFGFSPTVTRDHIDVIQIQDRDLAMVYAAERVMQRFENTPDATRAVQVITRYLDPLWRRVSKPL